MQNLFSETIFYRFSYFAGHLQWSDYFGIFTSPQSILLLFFSYWLRSET